MTIPALSPFTQKAIPIAQRAVAAAGIGASYSLVGSLYQQGVVTLIFISTLDQAVQVSFDGVTDHLAIPSTGIPIQINLKDNGLVLPGNFGIYVKEIGNPASGSLYVCAFGV